MLNRLIKVANVLDKKGLTKEADALDKVMNKISSLEERETGKSLKLDAVKNASKKLSEALGPLKDKHYREEREGDYQPSHWGGEMKHLGPAAMEMIKAVEALSETYHSPSYEPASPQGRYVSVDHMGEEDDRLKEQREARKKELGFSPDLPDEDLPVRTEEELEKELER